MHLLKYQYHSWHKEFWTIIIMLLNIESFISVLDLKRRAWEVFSKRYPGVSKPASLCFGCEYSQVQDKDHKTNCNLCLFKVSKNCLNGLWYEFSNAYRTDLDLAKKLAVKIKNMELKND